MRLLILCLLAFPLLARASGELTSETIIREELPKSSTAEKRSGLSADFSGAYNWGTYSSPGEPDNPHAGAAVNLAVGYRFKPGLNVGVNAGYSLPQISVPGATENASFNMRSLGLQAGWLVLDRFEPFIIYHPYSRLSQTTSTRLGTASVQTELAYQGMAFGGGAKVYLTPRHSGAVQIGLKLTYLREIYNQSRVRTEIQSNADRPSPAFNPTSAERSGDTLVSGNSYQMGLFIGI